MKSNDTHALGYVDGRAVFVGAELEQLTRKGWVRHNAQESWRGQNIDWKNDFRWPAEGVKPLFKLDRLDSLIHQLVNVASDLHRSIQPVPAYEPKESIRHLSPCDECAGTGSIGPDNDPTEMDCEICHGTGKAFAEQAITDSEIDMLAINNCLRIEVDKGTALRVFDLEHQRKFVRAALARQSAPSSAVPEGWKLVPDAFSDEANPILRAMIRAINMEKFASDGSIGWTQCRAALVAALAAAPTTATSSKARAEGAARCKECNGIASKSCYCAPAGSIADDAEFVRLVEVVAAQAADSDKFRAARRHLAAYIDARPAVGMVAAPDLDERREDYYQIAAAESGVFCTPQQAIAFGNKCLEWERVRIEHYRILWESMRDLYEGSTTTSARMERLLAASSAAPDMSVRDAALEEAAKVCDVARLALNHDGIFYSTESADVAGNVCANMAERIRALRSAPIGADQGVKDA